MERKNIYKAHIVSFVDNEKKTITISSDEPILLSDDSEAERETIRLSISDSILDIFNLMGHVFFEDEKISS